MSLCFQLKSVAEFLIILLCQQVGTMAEPLDEVKGPDCTAIFARNRSARSGIYTIKPNSSSDAFEVYCEKRLHEGWTVILRRNGKGEDGNPVNFRKSWIEYKKGFGDLKSEHWLGLDSIYALTRQSRKICQLLVTMRNCQGQRGYALYDSFKIGGEKARYRISLGHYRGNRDRYGVHAGFHVCEWQGGAGAALLQMETAEHAPGSDQPGDAFRGEKSSDNQDRHFFSTNDYDNDGCDVCRLGNETFSSCAGQLYGCGWWFSNCGMAVLTGIWHPPSDCRNWVSGIYWKTWSATNSLSFCDAMIKCI